MRYLRHFGLFSTFCLLSFHLPPTSAQTTRPSSPQNLHNIRIQRPFSPQYKTAVCCILQCAEKHRYIDTFERKAPHHQTAPNNNARTDKTKPKNKKIACLLAAFTRIQHCRSDLALLEKNMRKKLEDEETACKTSCATNEPCFSACTNIFSTRTINFEQTLRSLRPVCETLPTQAISCFSPAAPSSQTNAFSACISHCKVPD